MSFSMLINDTAKELYCVNLDDIFYISALCSVVLLLYLPTSSNIIHVHTLFTITVFIKLLTY